MCGKGKQITNTKRINIYLYRSTMHILFLGVLGYEKYSRSDRFSGVEIFF